MLKILIVGLAIFALAAVMTMTGRGGGNFYVLLLVLAGVPMHEAATTGQFILFSTSAAAMLVFRKGKTLCLPLALALGGATSGTAFFGGLAADLFSGRQLKLVFAVLLAAAGALMLLPLEEKPREPKRGLGYWNLRVGRDLYVVNLWMALPLAAAAGFFSGMVGVSGGSFLAPLMVLGCRLPMRLAVGTASAMVAATAFAGFLGHALQGNFNPSWAAPLAVFAVAGGALGGKLALKARPASLKTLFALTTLIAAGLMLLNALSAK